MSSRFGTAFSVTTFGESHGGAVGAVVDGVPPGVPFAVERVQAALDRRRPGQSSLSSPRQEPDRVQVLSGTEGGRTLGTPIALVVPNEDARPEAYEHLARVWRPGHADFTTEARFGLRPASGGGRASARETVGRVAAGAVARQVLEHLVPGLEVVAWVHTVADLEAIVDADAVTREAVDAWPVRCPDPEAAPRMTALIEQVRAEGDSVGGVVRVVARGVPAGLGEPVFDKLEAELARALLSLPAARGFEVGSGFAGTRLRGSAHNDAFTTVDGRVRTVTNHSGGVQGGISNGMPILCAVAFKPVSTVARAQATVDVHGRPVTLEARGRHDPCVLPRAVPIVEAMVDLVLVDHLLRLRGQCGHLGR